MCFAGMGEAGVSEGGFLFAHIEQSLVFTTGLKLSSMFICMSSNEA